uniref:Secreted protein n=1 Tax=Thraustotheca clavata TaxID=74557 RepID=A0A0A7CM47_9STRA|nr:secreted protein [Thraustotheca clavata]
MLRLTALAAIIQVAIATSTPAPTYDCGASHAPCYSKNGDFGGCYVPSRQGCCNGVPYFYVDASGVTANCCKDANGTDVIITHPNYVFYDCPSTPEPTTLTPTPTTLTPNTTTPLPVITTPRPNVTTTAPVVTTSPATTTIAPRACISVSVNHDATYCIDGPICSGDGILPAGVLCPKKGAPATADCHTSLPSYTSNGCFLPSDSVCQKIPTGAWGCVLKSA